MKNNKINNENKFKVAKLMQDTDIIENMKNLDFVCIFSNKKDSKYSSNSNLYLFLNPEIGLCKIESFEGRIDSIQLSINYQNKKSDDFSKNFSNSSWSSSTGTASGYGYAIKIGSLNVNGELSDTIEELKNKGRFIFPFAERYFFIDEDAFSKNEKASNPILQDIETRTDWFIENKIDQKYKNYFGQNKSTEQQENRGVLGAWDDYIRWNINAQNKDKITKQDKKFYTICKEIILKDIEDIKPLIDKNFLYQTTSLGQNFCHLMSLIQEPNKKQLLWGHFEKLSPTYQSQLINQNDLNGYNPLLIILQHSNIRPVKDKKMKLEYFEKYLQVEQSKNCFQNEKNSFLDCLLYGSSLNPNSAIEYLSKIVKKDIEIPLIFLKKERPFSTEQKVIIKVEGEDIEAHINSYVYDFIKAVNLNKKINQELAYKDNIQVKLQKI